MKRWLLLALIAFPLALVCRLPASVVIHALEDSCAPRCRITSPSGLAWAGSGQLFLRANPHSPWQDMGRVTWSPLWDGGRKMAGLDIGIGTSQITLRANFSDWVAEIQQLRLPASALPALIRGKALNGLSGTLNCPHATVSGHHAESTEHTTGQIDLEWQGLAHPALGPGALGDFQLKLSRSGADQAWHGPLSTAPGGPISLLGTLRLDLAKPSLDYDGKAQPTPEARERLQPALETLGKLDAGSGEWKVHIGQ